MSEVLLEVKNIKKHFPLSVFLFMRTTNRRYIKAVDGVSFSINKGETLGLVGESGCGKTTILKLLLFLESLTKGSIFFHGRDISKPSRMDLINYRRYVQAMFQDPYASLNPRMKVGDIIAEPIENNLPLSKSEAREKAREILSVVKLDPESASLYPHEFSGGQRQRISLARAIAIEPSLLVLDEPVSALDVSVKGQLMNLLMDIQQRKNLSTILIAHDLATVRHMSNKMAVMYLGKLVEYSDSESIFTRQLHPYTKVLFSAALPSRPGVQRERFKIIGEVPSPINTPTGCHFHPRCQYRQDVCTGIEPELGNAESDHQVACHRWREIN